MQNETNSAVEFSDDDILSIIKLSIIATVGELAKDIEFSEEQGNHFDNLIDSFRVDNKKPMNTAEDAIKYAETFISAADKWYQAYIQTKESEFATI